MANRGGNIATDPPRRSIPQSPAVIDKGGKGCQPDHDRECDFHKDTGLQAMAGRPARCIPTARLTACLPASSLGSSFRALIEMM